MTITDMISQANERIRVENVNRIALSQTHRLAN
jgi:hypothetical protein